MCPQTIPPIGAKSKSLADMLQQGRFTVPWHQRYYDWDASHVRNLLDDVERAIVEERSCHFLGSVMLIQTAQDREWNINDGQQRVITFLLICAWLCKASHDEGDDRTEGQLLRLLFDIGDMDNVTSLDDSEGLAPRVIPPRNDETNFFQRIRGKVVSANGKMTAAWKEIDDFFAASERASMEWRKNFANFLCNKLLVVEVLVEKDLDPNAIFEVLNHRGKHLEDMDLIKNYIFSFFNDSQGEARQKTVQDRMEGIYLAFNGDVKEVSLYVRCHLQMELGFLHSGEFYNDAKKRIGKESTPDERQDYVFGLLGKLAQKHRIRLFHTVAKKSADDECLDQLVKDSRTSNKKRNIYDYLADLRQYTIAYPAIFALLCYYTEAPPESKKRIARFANKGCQFLASYVQRIAHTQGSFKSSLYEAPLAGLAKKIGDEECVSKSQFMDALKACPESVLITDANYKEVMMTTRYSRAPAKARHILACIVEYEQSDIGFKESDITLEHILPKGDEYASGWDFDDAERVKYTHSLGNLTILHKRDNKPQQKHNQDFAAKKMTYGACSYKMTKNLCKHDNWTPSLVEKRQKALVDIAANIWNFK